MIAQKEMIKITGLKIEKTERKRRRKREREREAGKKRNLEVFLHLFRVDRLALSVDAGSNHVGTLVHVGEQERGADARLRVEAGAAVAVPARADLEVEWTINPVLLSTKNGRQVLRHRRILSGTRSFFFRLLILI